MLLAMQGSFDFICLAFRETNSAQDDRHKTGQTVLQLRGLITA
jgi:hypothetical protein